MITPRYSKTRAEGARHTACTKLNETDSTALHLLAVEEGVSDYELTRRIITAYIDGDLVYTHTSAGDIR